MREEEFEMRDVDFAFGVFREICGKGEQTLGKWLVGEVRSREVCFFLLFVCLFNGRNNRMFALRRGGKVDTAEEEEESCESNAPECGGGGLSSALDRTMQRTQVVGRQRYRGRCW